MHIRAYIGPLEKVLQQRFNNLNMSLFVSRSSKYVHLGLEVPLLSARVSSELIAIIRNFEKDDRDSKYCFVFPKLIHTTKWKHDYIIFQRKDI